VRHTYRVESSAGGRFLTVTRGSDFEQRIELPPQSGQPTPEAAANLATIAATYGIELCGPPLQPS
jgi:hypothetical protein